MRRNRRTRRYNGAKAFFRHRRAPRRLSRSRRRSRRRR